MTSSGAHQVVTAARHAVGLVLADGQHATLDDIARVLKLAHRALGVAERALSTTAPSDALQAAPGDAFARVSDDALPRGADDGSTTAQ